MAKSLQDLIAHCLKTDNWRLQLIKEWPTIFGSLSNKVFVETITDSTLILGVSDSCLMQELYFLSPLVLSTVQKSLGNCSIKQIRFKKAEIYARKSSQRHFQIRRPTKTIVLTSAEQFALNRIEDQELREALRMFCVRCHQEQNS